MMRAARLLLWVLLAAPAVSAQQPARPAGAQTPPTGTGRIAGVVVDAHARPVRSAIVTLLGAELPTGRAAISDDAGRFSFDLLPAGRFSLSASKPAYLKATYGAVRPGGTGTPITLAAAAHLTDVTLTMPHGGAIAGTVRDLGGAPLPGVQVSVARAGVASAGPQRAEGVFTDDRGAYRVFGLLPGTYFVMASTMSSGGLGEVGMMSTSQVEAALARLRQRGATAMAPGATPAPEPSPSSIVRPTETFSSTPIFAPGVASPASATPIVLGLGEERTGVDVVYQLVRSAAVSGTVSGAGPGGNVQISLIAEGVTIPMPVTFGAGPMLQSRQAGGDGEFSFTNVTPARYRLLARTINPSVAGGRAGVPPGALATANAPVRLFATMTIDVNGQDISGLSLVLQPARHLTGRLAVQSTASATPPDLTKIRVSLASVDQTTSVSPVGVPISTSPPAAPVGADGSFDFAGIIPGTYRLSLIGQPAGWWPASATLGGVDLFDQPLEIGSSDVSGVEIALSDVQSQIAGRLLQSNGAPAPGYFVIAFSADRQHWRPQARRLRSVRPSTDGEFRFDNLPAGDYFLAALTDADSDEWQSGDFLAQIVTSAVKVTIGQGEKKTQDLRIGR